MLSFLFQQQENWLPETLTSFLVSRQVLKGS